MLFYVALNFVLAAAPVLTQSTLPTSAQVPDIPSSVTRFTQISSALATATLALGLGNPADITNYPLCAVSVANSSPRHSTNGPILANLQQRDHRCEGADRVDTRGPKHPQRSLWRPISQPLCWL